MGSDEHNTGESFVGSESSEVDLTSFETIRALASNNLSLVGLWILAESNELLSLDDLIHLTIATSQIHISDALDIFHANGNNLTSLTQIISGEDEPESFRSLKARYGRLYKLWEEAHLIEVGIFKRGTKSQYNDARSLRVNSKYRVDILSRINDVGQIVNAIPTDSNVSLPSVVGKYQTTGEHGSNRVRWNILSTLRESALQGSEMVGIDELHERFGTSKELLRLQARKLAEDGIAVNYAAGQNEETQRYTLKADIVPTMTSDFVQRLYNVAAAQTSPQTIKELIAQVPFYNEDGLVITFNQLDSETKLRVMMNVRGLVMRWWKAGVFEQSRDIGITSHGGGSVSLKEDVSAEVDLLIQALNGNASSQKAEFIFDEPLTVAQFNEVGFKAGVVDGYFAALFKSEIATNKGVINVSEIASKYKVGEAYVLDLIENFSYYEAGVLLKEWLMSGNATAITYYTHMRPLSEEQSREMGNTKVYSNLTADTFYPTMLGVVLEHQTLNRDGLVEVQILVDRIRRYAFEDRLPLSTHDFPITQAGVARPNVKLVLGVIVTNGISLAFESNNPETGPIFHDLNDEVLTPQLANKLEAAINSALIQKGLNVTLRQALRALNIRTITRRGRSVGGI